MSLRDPVPPLTSYCVGSGRLHVCPTSRGLHVTIQQYGGPPHDVTLNPQQALDLMRLLQQAYGECTVHNAPQPLDRPA